MKNRYYRFFREDKKALVLAFDHASHGDAWVDPAKVIRGAREGGMDGILTTYGVINNFRKEIGKMGVMLRMDVLGSALGKKDPILGQAMESPYTVEDALRLGADGVMTMGIIGCNYDGDNVRYIAKVASDCDKYGLICASGVLPNGFSIDPEDRSVRAMNVACRLGAEVGLDIVKTAFVEPVEEFKKIVENCYTDVLALGGAKVDDDRAVLQNAKDAMDAGCKGLRIGRNVWGHSNIAGMARALGAVVHGNATVDEAMKELEK